MPQASSGLSFILRALIQPSSLRFQTLLDHQGPQGHERAQRQAQKGAYCGRTVAREL
jgi:hypothetical protein